MYDDRLDAWKERAHVLASDKVVMTVVDMGGHYQIWSEYMADKHDCNVVYSTSVSAGDIDGGVVNV